MSFKNFFYSQSVDRLLESVKQAKQYISQGVLSQDEGNAIIQADPTPQKKFAGWMAKQWISKTVNNLDELRNTVEEYNVFLNKGKAKTNDIYKFKTFNDLKQEVDYLNETGEGSSSKDLESDYEVIRDDEDLLVIVPHTHESSRKLGLTQFAFRQCERREGKDSAWCTTYKSPEHWNDAYYSRGATLYYVRVNSNELQQKLNDAGYGPEFYVVAIVVFPPELEQELKALGKDTMDAYDGNDKQFIGNKLAKYLEIINLK